MERAIERLDEREAALQRADGRASPPTTRSSPSCRLSSTRLVVEREQLEAAWLQASESLEG